VAFFAAMPMAVRGAGVSAPRRILFINNNIINNFHQHLKQQFYEKKMLLAGSIHAPILALLAGRGWPADSGNGRRYR
jgi:hypothetical protein